MFIGTRRRRILKEKVSTQPLVDHHQVRGLVLDAEVEDTDDMRMHQVAHMTSFCEKVLGGMGIYLGVQDLDGNLALEIDVLTQVDIGKGTFPQPAGQPVVAQTL